MPLRTHYICHKCGATDMDRGNSGLPPEALICHACRSGAGLTIADQISRRVGMLPASQVQED